MQLALHLIHLLFTKASSEMSSVEEWLSFLRKGNRKKRLAFTKLHEKWIKNQRQQVFSHFPRSKLLHSKYGLYWNPLTWTVPEKNPFFLNLPHHYFVVALLPEQMQTYSICKKQLLPDVSNYYKVTHQRPWLDWRIIAFVGGFLVYSKP